MTDDGKTARFFIQFIQSPFGSNPNAARSVFRNGEYPSTGNGGGVGGIIEIFFERITIKFIQSVLGPEPDESFGILENAFYFALRYTFLDRIMFKVNRLGRYTDPSVQEKEIQEECKRLSFFHAANLMYL